MKQKNIIFFHGESWDGRMIGPMGHPALKNATPNIDRIVQSGTLFENAYCSHPICCPSRANMWSGQYTHTCESWNNNKGLESGMWNLFSELAKTHTMQTLGKMDYMSGGHTQLARLSAWIGPSGIWKPVFDEDPSQCFTVADNNDIRFHEHDWKLIDLAVDFLKNGREPDKPFFLQISSGLVHATYETNNYWLDKIPEEHVDIPPIDDEGGRHPAIQYQRMAKAWRYGFDDSTVRQVRRIYMAMCAEADALVGALYDSMQELGLADDTYFVFSSDHGELAMEHQDWFKMSMYEGSVRVPLVIAGPGIRSGQRLSNLVSLIDICPTLMEMGGLEPRDGLEGESLLPLAAGRISESRNWAYACFMGCTLNTSAYLLRKDRWKYIVYSGCDPQELIDLARERPEVVSSLDADLRSIVDYEQTHRDWIAYCKETFRQWRRHAKRGLYVDGTYGLIGNPSNDYWQLMDNAFTGYNQDDEKNVNKWLSE